MDRVARWLRRLRANPWWFDSALALAAAGLSTAIFVFDPAFRGLPRGRFVLGCGLVLLHTVPLAARRRFPLAVLATSVASGLTFAALDLTPDLLWMTFLVAVYSVAAYGDRWISLAAWPSRSSAGWPSSSPRAGSRHRRSSATRCSLRPRGCWATSSVSAASMSSSWRSGPPSWNKPGRSWPAGR